ncbi:hypothetical protein [Rheinheimera tangshanensis]|jgi:hypothetical protein|uniref:hypothetical protein n=2 Tax=Rheinheimera tangshanensis TaxID=400153 RepID=UPI001E4E4F04|nr:hypothetical protein [Rheinheimera tangshanensis]
MEKMKLAALTLVIVGVFLIVLMIYYSGRPFSDVLLVSIVGVICFCLGYFIRGMFIKSK